MAEKPEDSMQSNKTGYNRFLLLVAGLGGLFYGIDVGIIVSLIAVGFLFHNTEKHRVDVKDAVQAVITEVDSEKVLASAGDDGKAIVGKPTTIAAIFLPTVGKYGYSTMFFAFAGCTVIYFITAAFFLPETKGKTLDEIEGFFEG